MRNIMKLLVLFALTFAACINIQAATHAYSREAEIYGHEIVGVIKVAPASLPEMINNAGAGATREKRTSVIPKYFFENAKTKYEFLRTSRPDVSAAYPDVAELLNREHIILSEVLTFSNRDLVRRGNEVLLKAVADLEGYLASLVSASAPAPAPAPKPAARSVSPLRTGGTAVPTDAEKLRLEEDARNAKKLAADAERKAQEERDARERAEAEKLGAARKIAELEALLNAEKDAAIKAERARIDAEHALSTLKAEMAEDATTTSSRRASVTSTSTSRRASMVSTAADDSAGEEARVPASMISTSAAGGEEPPLPKGRRWNPASFEGKLYNHGELVDKTSTIWVGLRVRELPEYVQPELRDVLDFLNDRATTYKTTKEPYRKFDMLKDPVPDEVRLKLGEVATTVTHTSTSRDMSRFSLRKGFIESIRQDMEYIAYQLREAKGPDAVIGVPRFYLIKKLV